MLWKTQLIHTDSNIEHSVHVTVASIVLVMSRCYHTYLECFEIWTENLDFHFYCYTCCLVCLHKRCLHDQKSWHIKYSLAVATLAQIWSPRWDLRATNSKKKLRKFITKLLISTTKMPWIAQIWTFLALLLFIYKHACLLEGNTSESHSKLTSNVYIHYLQCSIYLSFYTYSEYAIYQTRIGFGRAGLMECRIRSRGAQVRLVV